LAQAATRDILLLGGSMLAGLPAMGSNNFRLKAISGPLAATIIRTGARVAKI
jgi:hypothetical protein